VNVAAGGRRRLSAIAGLLLIVCAALVIAGVCRSSAVGKPVRTAAAQPRLGNHRRGLGGRDRGDLR
jgi:hypothetical protein